MITPSDFKQTLSRFLSGVTVIAAESDGQPHGMTASAFLSVSLTPPLVLVSVAKSARMHAVLATAPRWSASILAADQTALSGHFAGYGAADPEWIRTEGAAPRLGGSLAWVECTPWAAYDGGDHTLYVGHVEACGWRDGAPLTYFCGKYRDLAPLG